ALADSIVANGTLDARMTELFYTVQARGGDTLTSIYRADGPDFKDGAPIVFDGLTMADEVSPAVSAAGTKLWLGMLGASGNTDIYVSEGEGSAWSKPALVTELSSDLGDDAARPPAVNDTIMPLSSKRHGGNLYQIYLSERPDSSSPWGEPSQANVTRLNSSSFQSADGFLGENGTELYFSSTRDNRDGHSDLYLAARSSLAEPFAEPVPLGDLNLADSEERMPWLSPDGTTLYFASNRSGDYVLYVTSRVVR
ncbi:MAG TPA: hypothetical protein VNG33_10760, partial [Polyangiaceae bacterium]|nr:hypothetical protein [Polyangiaceae bacterium]